MTERGHIVRGGSWAGGARLVMVATSFLSATLVVRLLEPSDVGIYFAVLAAVGIAALVGSLGSAIPVTTFVGALPDDDTAGRRSVVARSYVIGAVGAMVVTFAFLVASTAVIRIVAGSSESSAVSWWYLAALSALFVLRTTGENALRALADIRSASVVQAMPPVLISLVLLAVWIAVPDPSLGTVLLIVAGAHAGAAFVAMAMLAAHLRGRGDTQQAQVPGYRQWLAAGLPWLGTTLLVYALTQVGVLVASTTTSTSEAALYGTAFRVASFVSIPAAVTIAVIPPFVVRYWTSDDHHRLESLMRGAATIAGLLAGAATIAAIVVGKPFLDVAFGDFYTDSWPVLVILAIAFVVDAGSGASGQMLALTGGERRVFAVFLVSTPIALALMWILGTRYGALGVALGSGIGLAGANVVMAVIAHRDVGVRTWMSWSVRDAAGIITSVRSGFASPHPESE